MVLETGTYIYFYQKADSFGGEHVLLLESESRWP